MVPSGRFSVSYVEQDPGRGCWHPACTSQHRHLSRVNFSKTCVATGAVFLSGLGGQRFLAAQVIFMPNRKTCVVQMALAAYSKRSRRIVEIEETSFAGVPCMLLYAASLLLMGEC